ncbi:MAG: nucleoside kinase [Eubacterium sp.]|jgi:uridine kinase|nr:nucleoside kinase [Eubacterium sp.]
MRIININSVNKWLISDYKKFINFCEEEYSFQILDVAAGIVNNFAGCPIILLSGPSGSSKTGSAFRLKEALKKFERSARVISMDNYFLSGDDTRNRLEENGQMDYESPRRLDIQLLSKHLNDLIECREIEVPSFNFKQQGREKGYLFRREKNEIIILEGIHALNPEITGTVSEHSVGIYVSVRTRLQSQNGDLLHPSKIRLARRFVRDRLFRGRSFFETFGFFKDVERGEEKYIMPFKKNASFDIDAFLPYEICVYRELMLEDLEALVKLVGVSGELDKLLEIALESVPVQTADVPDDSPVREFIGESVLIKT